MNVMHFIRDLEQQGVKLQRQVDRLTVDAPKGVLQPGTKELLTQQKPEIIKLLSNRPTVPYATLSDDDKETLPYGFEERYGIMEANKRITAQEAHNGAFLHTLQEFLIRFYPLVLAQYETAIGNPTWH